MADFPHMSDTSFPNVEQVDVWKFKNDFPYENFDDVQMRITVCAVPWDVGLIHVGDAQIGGLGNVVAFEDEAERDAWFENLEDKFTFETEYRKFHMEGKGGSVDGTIKLPIPYDVLSRYNYAIVEYTPMPFHLEKTGVRKWFYFIRESVMKAPNTTEVELILDAWQTFIYEMNIPYMMLERGHAPIAALSVEDYLANPIANTRYVTGDDVSYDDNPSVVAKESELVFNDGEDVYACVVVDSTIVNSWGAKKNTWRMPETHRLTNQGAPNYSCIAIPADEFNQFIANIDASYPQFKQSVKAIFFATEKMISLGSRISFCGYTYHYAFASSKTHSLLKLDKGAFAYDSKYANLAKLYTYPYAHIEIMDETGSTTVIRVEDTTGKLDVASSLSTVFPFITLTANVLGIGNGASRNVAFKNLGNRNFKYGGKWQEIALTWNIPTFAVVQSNDVTNDYATHFDRVQMKTAADNAYASGMATNETAYNDAIASNANAKTNSDIDAQAAKTVADRTADTSVANCATQTTANTNSSNTANVGNTATANSTNEGITSTTTISNAYTTQTTNNEVDAAYDSATVSAIGDVAGGALSGAASGMAAGPAGAAAGAVSGLIGGAVNTALNFAQLSITANLKTAQASAATNANSEKAADSKSRNSEQAGIANDVRRSTTTTANNAMTATTAASAACTKSNASTMQTAANTTSANTKATNDANAARDKVTADANTARERNTAYNAIENQVKQAALKPTNTFGSIANGHTATTRPLAMFAQVVTQNAGAIAAAGDEMLRFGYTCNMAWNFEKWNLMRHFTYWKVSDMWIDDFRLPDAYADRIRFTLMGGVCVWNSPDIIGKISIYENGI